jgi:hypothetical protein
MKSRPLAPILTVALLCVRCTHAATPIASWQFDDGVPTNTAAALATETNAPTLNATATKNGSGALPTFSEARPGPRIWASFTGPLLSVE